MCIRDLKMENERLKSGLNQNVVNANMSMHQKIKQYEKFGFPVYLTEADFTVESNEGMTAENIQLVKSTVVAALQVKQEKLYDVSSEVVNKLSSKHGGKWYCNIRPLNVEHGICLHVQIAGREICNMDFKVRGEVYRLRVMKITSE